MTKISIELTLEQASAVSAALEAYSRLGIGQIEHVAEMVSTGEISVSQRALGGEPGRILANLDQIEDVRSKCASIKATLGFSQGGSASIGDPRNAIGTRRAWEVRKILEKAIAEHRNPNPDFRGVNYDGLVVRYTSDPIPVAKVIEDECRA